jgi:multidrug efflux pump
MGQITGALVGIALVLSAVFVPMAFFGGSTGVIYRQFSMTIVSAMVLSVLVAMIFTPALCATMLKPVEKGHHLTNKGFFGWFNRTFDRSTNKYQGMVGSILNRGGRSLAVYGIMLVVLAFVFMRLPTSFLPEEDQGVLFSQIQLPTGATQERTLKVIEKVEDHFMNDEKNAVASVFAVAGFSFAGNGQNAASPSCAEGLVRASGRSEPRQCDCRPRHGQVLADQGCDGVCVCAAGRAGTG